MKRLRNSELRDIISKTEELYGKALLSKSDDVTERTMYIKGAGVRVLISDRTPKLMLINDSPVPTLHLLLEIEVLPKVVVDMGAVRFMASGADIMRPGITVIPEGLEKGDMVVIVDEKHHKPLAVGKTLFSSSEIRDMGSGRVIANIHHVGDSVWALGSQ